MTIPLFVIGGTAYVWRLTDWSLIREKYRIVAENVGMLASNPHQEIVKGLPAALRNEEATLLREKGYARLVKCKALVDPPSEKVVEACANYLDQSEKEQRSEEQTLRRFQPSSKLRKSDKQADHLLNHPAPSNTEKDEQGNKNDKNLSECDMRRNANSMRVNPLIHIPSADSWITEGDLEDAEWNYPSSERDFILYATFRDLWSKGYYLSSGAKFGGDFLAYPGDPIKHHSHFIVICKNRDDVMSPIDIIGYGRLGCSTKKTPVIAYFAQDGISVAYQSIQWEQII